MVLPTGIQTCIGMTFDDSFDARQVGDVCPILTGR